MSPRLSRLARLLLARLLLARLPRRLAGSALAGSALAGLLAAPVRAQDVPRQDALRVTAGPDAPGATLTGWAHGRRLLVLDRVHNLGDDFGFDRGLFRHVMPDMDREYVLDQLVYRFTPAAAARWQAGRAGPAPTGGLRIRAGSIARTRWAFVTDLAQRVDLGPHDALAIDVRLQEDPAAERAFLELSYAHAFSARHRAGVRHTFSRYKPDFDASLFYRLALPRWGAGGAEVTLDNAYNDFIVNLLGVSARDQDLLRTYDRPPLLLQADWATPPDRRLRAEVAGGWRPAVTVRYASQTDDGLAYRDREGVRYVGALVEARLARTPDARLTGGLLLTHDRATLRRTGATDATPSAYRTEQAFTRAGAYLLGAWRFLHGEASYARVRYVDRQTGTNFTLSSVDRAFRFPDARHAVQARATADLGGPRHAGAYLGLEYAAVVRSVDRAADELLTEQFKPGDFYWTGPSNYRAAVLTGYRWARGSLLVGVGIDLDNDDLPPGIPDSPGRFDNGYGRLTIFW